MKKISAQKTHENKSAKKKGTKFIHEKKQCTIKKSAKEMCAQKKIR